MHKIGFKSIHVKPKNMRYFDNLRTRNFLVHRYGTIDDDVAFRDIKNGLPDFKLFKEEIRNYLSSLSEDEKSSES